MTEHRLPLRPQEAAQLQLLCGAAEILAQATPLLEKRLKSVGKWPQYRTMQTWLPNMVNALETTIEPRKLALFHENLRNHELRVVYKGAKDTREDMTTCYADDLTLMISICLKSECSICMGGRQDMKKCQFRKVLKRMTMFELDESGGVCMGKQIEIRNDV